MPSTQNVQQFIGENQVAYSFLFSLPKLIADPKAMDLELKE